MDEIYPQMLKDENIEAGAPGSLEDIISMDPVKLAFLVPLAPKVDLKEYSQVREEYVPPVVTDVDVDKTLEQYRNYTATLEPTDKPAADGMVVYCSVKAFEKGAAEGTEPVLDRNHSVRIDSKAEKNEGEWPFSGFGSKLIGVKEGDVKEISHSYPKDYAQDDLAGKKVEFIVKIDSIKNVVLPELNEAFFHNFGEYHTLEEFKAEILKNLEAEAKADYDSKYFQRIIEKIRAQAEIKYPPQVLEEEKKNLRKTFEEDLASRGYDMTTYLKVKNLTEAEFEEKELITGAKDRLERSLVMDAVAKAEKIELKNEDLEASYTETLQDLSSTQDFAKMAKKTPKKQLVNAIAMEAASRLMNRKIYESLKTIANGEGSSASTEATETPKPKVKKAKTKAVKGETTQPEGE